MSQNNFIRSFFRTIGMDRAIAYGSGARVFQAIAGVVTIFFIATFLTGEEQGYYYTFNSLLAIQTFFELGFTNIITQFVAHEVSHLRISNDNTIEGDLKYRSRLSSLLHFSVKWYSVASLLFLVIVLIVGFLFFKSGDEPQEAVNWIIPWLILCVATAIKMFQSPFTAILLGLDKVVEMNEITFIQQIITPIFMWVLLVSHCGLYVVGVSSIVAVVVWFVYVFRKGLFQLLREVHLTPINENVNYFKEIFPYQWKIALSSLSGYFVFYFLTPILFKYQGAVIAGQVGLSISVIGAIQSFSMSWLSTKVPYYSRLIALKQFEELDAVFSKTIKQMVSVCLCLMLLTYLFFLGIAFIGVSFNGELLSDRFLTGWPLAVLMLGYVTDQFTFSWATYLRCHKREPYLVFSVVTGALCLLGILISSMYSTVSIIILVYSLIRIVTLPWGYYIFLNNKNKWHIQ